MELAEDLGGLEEVGDKDEELEELAEELKGLEEVQARREHSL